MLEWHAEVKTTFASFLYDMAYLMFAAAISNITESQRLEFELCKFIANRFHL